MVESLVEVFLVGGKVSDAWDVEGDDTDGTGGFARTEEATRLLTEFTQVETETAAHGADVAWLHIGVDVVGEIWSAIFRGHLEEKLVVLGFRPVEILGDGIGWDWILEAAAVRVAFDHGLDEGFVDHRHFLFAITIFEVHLLTAD